jgi:hypothetical protein
LSQSDDIVASTDGDQIIVTSDGQLPGNFSESASANGNDIQIYHLHKY